MPKHENELLRKSALGDAAAFGEIVRRYQSLVYAVAMQIAKDPAAAQDITQETFISAFASLKNLRSEEAFPSWLRTITRNTALAWVCSAGQDKQVEPQGRGEGAEEAEEVNMVLPPTTNPGGSSTEKLPPVLPGR